MKFPSDDYEHYVPPAKPSKEFPDDFGFVLVDSMEDFIRILKDNKDVDYVAWDLETTGLNPEENSIVALALAFHNKNNKVGYCVPINFNKGPSLHYDALALFYKFLRKYKKRSLLYNARFDMRFMEIYGFDMDKISVYDVMLGIWLADTNVKFPSLSASARHFLGWEMQEYDSVLGDDYNLWYVAPKEVTFYAGSDALATLHLAKHSFRYLKEAKLAGKIDNRILYPLMKFEDDPLRIDVKYLGGLLDEYTNRQSELEKEIHIMAGYDFNINSSRQLVEVMMQLGLNTGKYTKTGQMQTSLPVLEKLEGQNNHPFLEKLMEYKRINKSLGSYIKPLTQYAKESKQYCESTGDGYLRFAYHNTVAPTGRFACGSEDKNSYFSKINKQSIPKPSERIWYVAPTDEPSEEVSLNEHNIEGYKFSTERISEDAVEAFSPEANVRRGFIPYDDFYWVSVDFSKQELLIPTNITQEPIWKTAFKEGKDLHSETALKIFGEVDKHKRALAKTCNFGLAYGMSHHTLAERFDMPVNEAEKFVEDFKGTLKELFSWMERHKRKAKREGVVYTSFGRPRRLKYYFEHESPQVRAFGYRSAVNSVIQGTGADIMKMALVKLWDNLLNVDEYRDDVRFASMVHDEANFYVRKSKLLEILPKIIDCMELKFPQWELPMEVDVEIGNSWGFCFPFDFKDGVLTPKLED